MPQAPSSGSGPPQAPQNTAAQGVLFTRNYVLLCVGAFLFSGSMFVLFAVLPLFVVQELHGAESQVGLIMGAFALAAVLTRPLSGQLVSIWSRKSGLSLGTFIYFLAPALYTLVGSVPVMLGLRFFHGIGIAIYTTRVERVCRRPVATRPARRSHGLLRHGAEPVDDHRSGPGRLPGRPESALSICSGCRLGWPWSAFC